MVRRVWLTVAVFALVSCGADTPTSPKTDWIELNALTPASGIALTPGERPSVRA